MSISRDADPVSLPENAAFAIMMVLAAYLSRENPDFRYPEILWAFLIFFGFNLAYFSKLKSRLAPGRAAGLAAAGNILLACLIVELSGGPQSYLWVMYLLPLFSAGVALEKRGAFAAGAAVLVGLGINYRGAVAGREWFVVAEMGVKILTLVTAALAIARVAARERRTRRLLDRRDRERAEERLETQARLRHLDRLATMGTLMAGITHELKGPLSTVLAATDLLLEGSNTEQQTAELLRKIRRAGEKSQQNIQNMLGFARKEPGARRPTDLVEMLKRCVALKRHDWVGGDIVVGEDYAAGLGTREASEAELEQVVFNLLQNAEQAIRSTAGKRGKITVAAAGRGGRIVITVGDDGPGIPPGVLERIWEPFFTTKDSGQGTGLGLAISRDIVKAHGGTLTAQSRPGRTVFAIELPA